MKRGEAINTLALRGSTHTVGTVYIETVAKGVTLTNIPLLDHLLAL